MVKIQNQKLLNMASISTPKEELDFYEWILEAKKFGFIESFEVSATNHLYYSMV